jgi:outer membrane protein TolC
VLVTLIGDVASDYVAIRTLQQQIAIAHDNIVKQKMALQIARDRYRGGATSELDPLQAENVLAQTQSAIPQLTAQLQQDENALRVLLGMTPESLDGLLGHGRGIPAPPAKVAVGIPADLLRRRPDVRAAELKAAAQSAQVGIAEADLYPAFSLGGVFGTLVSTTNGNRISQLFTSPSLTFAFGPSFSWPVLNYGQVLSIGGLSVLDNSADLFNSGVAWVMLKPFDERLKAKDQDLLSICKRLEGGRRLAARRQGLCAAAAGDPGHRQRRRLPDAG